MCIISVAGMQYFGLCAAGFPSSFPFVMLDTVLFVFVLHRREA